MQIQTIKCPKCSTDIQLTESLIAPTIKEVSNTDQHKFQPEIDKLNAQLKDLQKQIADLSIKLQKEDQKIREATAASATLKQKLESPI
jgi:peptidoglycan hydrolase CwlO-like protein